MTRRQPGSQQQFPYPFHTGTYIREGQKPPYLSHHKSPSLKPPVELERANVGH
ncbi:unnamed protein product [Penicillium camemberti]|uniref:Str. FM013 n=1 Tax=Penicillium camemberti (strain FM 013) TaxID=1429867 RepID=A0A0G4PM32_PENC3|nr:unnamed protein product [Penicillium camemberti]